jgi:tetratricopeptide (TPR) repeat protein
MFLSHRALCLALSSLTMAPSALAENVNARSSATVSSASSMDGSAASTNDSAGSSELSPTPGTAPPLAPGENIGPSSGATSAENPPDPYAEARQRVVRGETLFEEGNYDAALAEFERAYQTMEGHPARYLVLFNIGQCYEKLYRYDGAIDAYRGYLQAGGETAEDAPTVRAKMDLLATLLGRLEIDVSTTEKKPVPDYELWVDGRFIGKNKTQALLPGGNHEVEIRASGFEYKKLPLQLPATAARSLSFELEPLAEEYRGLRPTLFWTTTALAVGTAIAGGVFGTLALSERNSIDSQIALGPPDSLSLCGATTPCGSPGAEDPSKRIENLATTADVFFVASGVFTVTAVVLGFMTDFSGHPKKEAVQKEATSKKSANLPWIDVSAAPGGGRLTLQGAF